MRQYDATTYERFSVSVDIVVFSVDSRSQQDNYRKLDEQKLTVLLLKRSEHPHLDKWSLPGGFVAGQESLDQAVNRILRDKTSLSHVYTEQLYTFGHPLRDPRTRIVSTAYLALIDRSQYRLKNANIRQNADPAWFEIDFPRQATALQLKSTAETLSLPITATESLNGKIKTTIYDVPDNYATHHTVPGNTPLAFDHAAILLTGLLRIRNKIQYTDIVFNLLPDTFTITHLQQIYEIILGEKLLAPAFRRKISGKIQPTGEYSQEKGHRPSQFYTYKGEQRA